MVSASAPPALGEHSSSDKFIPADYMSQVLILRGQAATNLDISVRRSPKYAGIFSLSYEL
jgi:hypothetical protein